MSDGRQRYKAYAAPNDYHELSEVITIPLAEQERHRASNDLENHLISHRPAVQEGKSKRSIAQEATGENPYEIPDDYQQLDEVAASGPVDEERRPQDDLENRYPAAPTHDGVLHEGRSRGDPLPSPPSPQSSNVGKEPTNPVSKHRVSKLVTELYTISYLVFFSILGTLSRLGLQALTFYPGAPVQVGLLWANVGGSFVLGFFAEDRKLFQTYEARSPHERLYNAQELEDRVNDGGPELRGYIAAAHRQESVKRHVVVKKTIPLYIGITVGYCGSFTSFSSFIRDCFLALANALPVPVSHPYPTTVSTTQTIHRNGGYSVMALLAVIIITVGLSICALKAGAHLALAVEGLTAPLSITFVRRYLDIPMMFIAWLAWMGAIIMAIWPPDRPSGPSSHGSWANETWRGNAIFAMVFAPLGCLLRFYVSLHANGIIKAFPLGTFAVNIIGTALEGMFYDLQHVPLGGRVGCQVLQGMQDGFCGCLTTVSTWAAELVGLRKKHAYVYGLSSVAMGVALMVVVMGSLLWTRGFATPACGG